MGRLALGTGAALAFAATAALGATPGVVTQPDWLAKPTGESMAEHFPIAGQVLNIEGDATISCTVNAQGSLVDCKVVDEHPKDIGFGQAALAMSGEFRMKPMTVNGQPVSGGTVRIPIGFRLPQPDPQAQPPSQPPPPPSPEILKAAEALVDAMGVVDQAMKSLDDQAHKVETAVEGSESGAARAGAAGAIRRAAAAHKADLRAAYARAFAAVFSEEEMAAMTRFQQGYGKLLQDPEMLAAQQQAMVEAFRTLRSAGHQAFCAKHDCGSPETVARVWRPIPGEGRIDNPQWTQSPSDDDVEAAAPEVLPMLGVTGVVRLTCEADKQGTLSKCAVDEEAPARLGFGAAALKQVGDYRLSAVQLRAGAAGRKVTVRIGFPPPDLPPAVDLPKARSPQALALGRQIAGATMNSQTRLQLELQIAGYESKIPSGADHQAFEDAIAAFRASADQAVARYLEVYASVYASRFNDEQLAGLAAFYASPAGKAAAERWSAVNVATTEAVGAVNLKVSEDARAIYCGTHDCTPVRRPSPAAAKPAAS
jgi:TonB family protein